LSLIVLTEIDNVVTFEADQTAGRCIAVQVSDNLALQILL
jgi:hypothetical protein